MIGTQIAQLKKPAPRPLDSGVDSRVGGAGFLLVGPVEGVGSPVDFNPKQALVDRLGIARAPLLAVP